MVQCGNVCGEARQNRAIWRSDVRAMTAAQIFVVLPDLAHSPSTTSSTANPAENRQKTGNKCAECFQLMFTTINLTSKA
jgi:hypothetical protein